MIRTRALSFCFSAVLLICSAVTATAQQAPATRPAPPPPYVPGTPTYELTGGYQLLHLRDSTFPFGLNVDGARHYGSFGLVAEIGFAIDSKIMKAEDLNRRYRITSTPTMIVNGRYVTDATMAGGEDALFEVINALVAREKPKG